MTVAVTFQGLLTLLAVGAVSAYAGQPTIIHGADKVLITEQLFSIDVNPGSSGDGEEDRPTVVDLGRLLSSRLAFANGQLYKEKMERSQGVIEGTTPPDDSNMLCGAECASCNTATGQCTKCMEGAVLIMDATAPNQLKCRSCNDLNCKAGACTDGFGCSACPVGYGISMREPPFACTLPCPSNCVDCDAGRALWPSENVRCNACAQGYMLTESGFCEEEGVGPTAEGPILQVQQGAGLTEAVSILGSLLSGLSGAALAVEPGNAAGRQAYLTAAARRQDLKTGFTLEALDREQAATVVQNMQPAQQAVPVLVSFGDFDSTAFADARGAVQAASLKKAASMQPAVNQPTRLQLPGPTGCLHGLLSKLLQSSFPGLPFVELRGKTSLQEQGTAASLVERDAPLVAVREALDAPLAAAADSTAAVQDVDARWTTLMNSLMGTEEGDAFPSDLPSGEQPVSAGFVKLTDPQPLGAAWTGLTASMWKALPGRGTSAPGRQDSLVPDDVASDSGAVLTSSAEEPREAVVSREAVVAAAKELAARTGVSVDAALDRAVSAVLQAGTSPAAAATAPPLGGNRRFGPADWAADSGDKSLVALDESLLTPGEIAASPGMAVPPQSGPLLDAPRPSGGLLSRLLTTVSTAIKEAAAALSSRFISPAPAPAKEPSQTQRIVRGVAAADDLEGQLEEASRDAAAAVAATGSYPAGALERLQTAAEAAVRARFAADDSDTTEDLISGVDDTPAGPVLAYASGRGGGSAGVANIFLEDENNNDRSAGESRPELLPSAAAVFNVAPGTEPSLVSDMEVPAEVGQAGGVSANSLNNAVLRRGVAIDFADPTLLS